MITHHTQLLQYLIDRYGLKSYLEIGVQNPGNNFDKIKCDKKYGIDPGVAGINIMQATSDDYFEQTTNTHDLIFIDGLHHADQVGRDFENSLRCLSDNGFIVIHDCLPENEAGTMVPRETKQWWGDVWKFCINIGKYPFIDFVTLDADEGCMIIWKSGRQFGCKVTYRTDWNNFLNCARDVMKVVSPAALESALP